MIEQEPFCLLPGDCLDRLREMPDNYVDSIVTDPPYGLRFMGKRWDADVPSLEIWIECLRVLKPGGHLLAFAGTRTYHRMAVRVEDAGFEIRDMIAWVYGSGFPKSKNLSGDHQGWGTALKPAMEPLVMARKPLVGNVESNVRAYGTGAINVDGCRIEAEKVTGWGGKSGFQEWVSGLSKDQEARPVVNGRWPANLIHDGSDEVVGLFPHVNGRVGMDQHASGTNTIYNAMQRSERSTARNGIVDSGSAARFFYCAKATPKDRDEFLEDLPAVGNTRYGEFAGTDQHAPKNQEHNKSRNHHPTVKPTALMGWLIKLVTPSDGVVLDPFTGSGSTGKAAMIRGFRFIGIERDPEYFSIAWRRIEREAIWR